MTTPLQILAAPYGHNENLQGSVSDSRGASAAPPETFLAAYMPPLRIECGALRRPCTPEDEESD